MRVGPSWGAWATVALGAEGATGRGRAEQGLQGALFGVPTSRCLLAGWERLQRGALAGNPLKGGGTLRWTLMGSHFQGTCFLGGSFQRGAFLGYRHFRGAHFWEPAWWGKGHFRGTHLRGLHGLEGARVHTRCLWAVPDEPEGNCRGRSQEDHRRWPDAGVDGKAPQSCAQHCWTGPGWRAQWTASAHAGDQTDPSGHTGQPPRWWRKDRPRLHALAT